MFGPPMFCASVAFYAQTAALQTENKSDYITSAAETSDPTQPITEAANSDGDITRTLTHPSLKKKKIYEVTLDRALTRADFDTLAEGVTLEDGEAYFDEISWLKDDKKSVGVEIHSGRNRIVRRMFEHLGYQVTKLDRVYYAGLTKKNLKRGAWRFLTVDEVNRLKSGRYE